MKHLYHEQVLAIGSYFGQLNELYSQWAKRHGLTYNKVAIFYTLHYQEWATQSQVCREWGISKQTLSTICKEMEREGYISYDVPLADKREKLMRLTPKGRDVIGPHMNELETIESKSLDTIGTHRFESMLDTMHQFLTQFSEESAKFEK